MTHTTNKQARIKRSGSTGQYLELTIPYYFSSIAREREENLQVSDYVKVAGLHGKFEIIDIFPRFGSVRVRTVGGVEGEGLVFPWDAVVPWKNSATKSNTAMRAIGAWLFAGNRVYSLSEPDRILKTVKVNWDAETSDVEDEDGRVFLGIPWDDLEFWDPVEYHFPEDE